MSKSGLRGSGKIVRIRIRILLVKFLLFRIRNGSDQFQNIVMGSHKIQIFSRTDIAIAPKLLYFGNLTGYKRNLPPNNQNNYNFFVILRTKSEKFSDFHKNHMDPGNRSGSVRIRQFLRMRNRILLAKKHGSGSAQPCH